jgi:DNA-binding IclR family transcriptional regulator
MAGALEKAFDLIRSIRRTSGSLGVTEIARSLRIAPSTAHALLNELVKQGAVTVDEQHRYRLGPAMYYLGAAYVRNVPIYRTAWPELRELARDVALTAVAAVPWQGHHLILDVHSNGSPGFDVAFGGLVPIDAGAWGKAYYAWSDAAVPKKLASYTPRTVTDLEEYERCLLEVRELGYARDVDEFVVGSGAIASAVTSERGLDGIVALMGTTSEVGAAGADVARRLASVAVRASYALGDHGRVKLVGAV